MKKLPKFDFKEAIKRGGWRLWLVLAAFAACCVMLWIYWQPLYAWSLDMWEVVSDRDTFRQRIESYGAWGPLVFIGFQIAQVIFSPIPGELVGAAGGYIFGWWEALLYSTIGLSIASWINFFLARLLGKGLVDRLVPPAYMSRMAVVMERQGVVISFIFFVFPGFPKDVLCYVLGVSPMRWPVFMVLSSIGRIPGTLMLSLQGALVYHEQYWSFALLLVLSLAFVAPVWIWREKIYTLLYRLDKSHGPLPDGEDED